MSVFQAGYPPPLALASGRYLNSGPNPPLGYLNGSAQAPVAWVLPEGETLLLFSDGLIERRGSSLVTGMERLQTATQDLGKRPLTALADRVLAQAGTGADDDVTLLVLRTTDVFVRDTPVVSGFRAGRGQVLALTPRPRVAQVTVMPLGRWSACRSGGRMCRPRAPAVSRLDRWWTAPGPPLPTGP